MGGEPSWVHEGAGSQDVSQDGSRNAQIVNIDNGKYIAVVAMCAALCGISCVQSYNAAREARDATTEYRVLLNHTMELEAAQKAMENSHVKR